MLNHTRLASLYEAEPQQKACAEEKKNKKNLSKEEKGCFSLHMGDSGLRKLRHTNETT